MTQYIKSIRFLVKYYKGTRLRFNPFHGCYDTELFYSDSNVIFAYIGFMEDKIYYEWRDKYPFLS